jgi:hypothetical protein
MHAHLARRLPVEIRLVGQQAAMVIGVTFEETTQRGSSAPSRPNIPQAP